MHSAAPKVLSPRLESVYSKLGSIETLRFRGRVENVTGSVVTCRGVPASVGDLARVRCEVDGRSTLLEAVGFQGSRVVFLPLEPLGTVGPKTELELLGAPLSVRGGEALLGRVLDGLGRPMDGGSILSFGDEIVCRAETPNPLQRNPIRETLATGVSSIDGMLTFGKGQRLGIFAGGGVGKSTLLGKVARESSAEVNIIAMIGERGLEVRSFLEESLGPEGLARSVVVVSTSDTPAQQRYRASFLAVALAEYFREKGSDVLFIMDSVTRFANAVREIGLARGEPPTLRGYPPSLFALLPQLVERLGNSERGSASCLMTVLVEGDDMADPVADTMRALLDGHIVLSRDLAAKQHYPAVDILQSVSRAMSGIVGEEHRGAAEKLRRLYAIYRENEDLIQIGAYKRGANPELDQAVSLMPTMNALLRQGTEEKRALEDTLQVLVAMMGSVGS